MEDTWEKVNSALLDIKNQEVEDRPKDAFTAKEFMLRFNITRNVAMKRLAKLKAAGKIRSVSFRVKKDNGVIQLMDGYQLVTEKIHAASNRKGD